MPNPVLNLVASPKTTTSVGVKWSYPQGAQPYYKYFVQTYNDLRAVINTTVSMNSTDIPNLESGTRYSINVTTIAETGSESTEEQTFTYTSNALHLSTVKLLKHYWILYCQNFKKPMKSLRIPHKFKMLFSHSGLWSCVTLCCICCSAQSSDQPQSEACEHNGHSADVAQTK